jgi:subtilisin-like proprotein convertase family protein
MRFSRLPALALAGVWAGLSAGVSTAVAPPDGLWQRAEPMAVAPGEAWVAPVAAAVFQLDGVGMRARLARAPREFTAAAAVPLVIQLPLPDGTLARFGVVESPIMAPELAALFPEVQTYAGQGLDDPAASVRLDLTPTGLHAQILAPGGVIYIDPERRGDAVRHLSYHRRDLRRTQDFQCLVQANAGAGFQPAGAPLFFPAASGSVLRTYRLAVAATGEYTQFHGGTAAAGMAAIVTAINRVTGILESELAIRLVLVANNQLLVYTNANTDPYSNNNANSLLTQNQSTIDSVIGSANYDLGHVFSTAGGGLALLGGVCVSGQKAQGETGQAQPVGDAFYVDFVVHEMGHQLGANHTFNGVNGSCSGNREAPTAFEPGSGSTIMSYAGLCDADDLQSNSDPYFHSASYDEILANVTAGTGRTCAGTNLTGNTPPFVSAGANYTIPRSTPFRLTATGGDPDGHPVTYCWEERDLGASQALASADNGSSPLLRVYAPTSSPVRVVPQLPSILNNTSSPAERLPTTSRTLNFRVTARDNRAGGGGVNAANMTVTVTATAGPFTVTSPNTPVAWSGPRTVTWNVAGTTNAPVSAATVDLLLSTNGGFDFPHLLAGNVPNDGSQEVILPNVVTTAARIMVRATGNIFFDISDSNFSIAASVPTAFPTLDGVRLAAEGCLPTNGVVDAGETVTLEFALRNVGSAPTTNLVGTLLNLGGVTSLGPAQEYGVLLPGGPAVARSFAFLAGGTCGSNIAPRLQLQDGSTSLGTVVQVLTLGSTPSITNTFTSAGSISIAAQDAATPYPSTLNVSGVGNPIVRLSVTLSNLSHTYPDDLDVLLVGPGGQKVMLLSDAGGGTDITSRVLTFEDLATGLLPDETSLVSGVYKPTNYGTSDGLGSPAPAEPYATALSAFNGLGANGTWSLYVWDDASSDAGSLAGWRLTVVTQGPAVCCVSPPTPVAAMARTGLDARVSFNTVTGRQYRVETTSLLGPGASWSSLPGAASLPGTGGTLGVTDTNALIRPQRFYRVVLLP